MDLNWEGGSLPEAGDDVVIRVGTGSSFARGNAVLGTGDPGSITVLAGATFGFDDNKNFLDGAGGAVPVHIYGAVTGRRSGETDVNVTMYDGSTIDFTDNFFSNSSSFGDASMTVTLNSGDVTVIGGNPATANHDLRVGTTGSGNLIFDLGGADHAVRWGGGGDRGHTGDVIFREGVVTLLRAFTGASLLTEGDVTIEQGAGLDIATRQHEPQPFSDTTVLRIDGDGSSPSLNYLDTSTSKDDTVLGMVLGGTAVTAGQWTVADLQSTYGNYIDTNQEVDGYTFNVLTTIPEPASIALMGLGGSLILLRRRQPA